MRHNAVAEKRVRPRLIGAVEKLIDDHQITRMQIAFQRSHGGHRDDPFDLQHFHPIDIGAAVHLCGRQAMALAVTRQKHHLVPFQPSGEVFIRRIAERRIDVDRLHVR